MAAGDWTTPTYRHRWGQYVRHTLISVAVEMNGTTNLTLALSRTEVPQAIFAGRVWGSSTGSNASQVISLLIKSGLTTVGDSTDNVIYDHDQTCVTSPDGWTPRGLFENVTAPTNANFMGGVTLPTNELDLDIESDGAGETDTVVSLYIALLSHRLEV